MPFRGISASESAVRIKHEFMVCVTVKVTLFGVFMRSRKGLTFICSYDTAGKSLLSYQTLSWPHLFCKHNPDLGLRLYLTELWNAVFPIFLSHSSFPCGLPTMLSIEKNKYSFLHLSDEGTKLWKSSRDLSPDNSNINYHVIWNTCFSI